MVLSRVKDGATGTLGLIGAALAAIGSGLASLARLVSYGVEYTVVETASL